MKNLERLKPAQLTISSLIILLLFVVTAFGQTKPKADELHKELKNGNVEKVKEIIENDITLLESQNPRGSTPLMLAAADGQKDLLKYIIKKGADVNKANTYGNTALHYTAWESKTEMFKLLVEQGAKLNVENSRGQNPLHYSCMGGSLDIFNYCISKGMDINKKCDDGSNLIHWAALGGNLDIFKYLESKGMDYRTKDADGSFPISWAARGNKVEILKYLVEQKKMDVNVIDEKGTYPLQAAVRRGNYDAAKYLIEKGADINVKLEDNATFLLFATYNTNAELVKLLLDKGSELNIFDDRGNTPLLAAASRGNLEIVKLLIDKGAKMEPGVCKRASCTNSGDSPLHRAASSNPAVVEYLLEKGADVNATDFDGNTPLHRMYWGDSIRTVDILCKNGGKINLQNNKGETPLIKAIASKKTDYIRALLKHKADISLADHAGKTPLHYASISGYSDMVNLLIENGADIHVKDQNDRTPAYYAVYHGNKNIAEHLFNKGAVKENMPFKKAELLSKDINQGEAIVWYSNHSGWLVKTKNHLLVFDYWQPGTDPDNVSINNGRINPKEIENQNVMVFASHSHGDHYSSSIFDWSKSVKNIKYVMGFEPQIDHAYTYIAPREEKTIDHVKITTIPSTDSGEGFMVEVDGVSIYHPGDHANRYQDEDKAFSDEIDFLAKTYTNIDIAFVPISGCRFRDKIALNKGNDYLVKKFNPEMVLPMHGSNSEYKYKEYADEKNKAENTSIYKYVLNKGDRLFYKNNGHVLGYKTKN